MPGVKRKVSTTSFSGSLQSSLGIAPAGGKRAKTVTRKEKRKAERMKKRKPPAAERVSATRVTASGGAGRASSSSSSSSTMKKKADRSSGSGSGSSGSGSGGKKRSSSGSASGKGGKSSGGAVPANFVSVSDDPEDMEIARLEKLLGVTSKGKNREKSASKLNKEFEMYEGIGGKFGDFLMQLDDFAQYAKSDATPSEKKSFLSVNDSDSESDNEVRDEVPRLLNDSDQEASDLEMDLSDSDSDDDDDDDDEEEDEEEEVEEGEGWFDDADEYAVAGHDYSRNRSDSGDSGSDDEGDSGSDSGSDDGDSSGDEDDFPEQDHAPGSTYRPVQGEDIYGRVVDSGAGSSTTTSKYMPPAVRKKMEEEAARKAGTTSTGSATKTVGAAAFTIDDNSEQSRLLKRKINGQLNRLSEQSRDSIVKGLQEIFAQNSFTLCCHILKDCLLSVCSNSTQLMNTLIPHYAGLIAALHHSVDFQIGSYVLESLVVKLYSLILESDNKDASPSESTDKDHSLISNKTSSNLLLIITHLYNLRVVHHGLIMDIFLLLVNELKAPIEGHVFQGLTTLRVELILSIVENCGQSLRGDDPAGLKQGIVKVMKMTQNNSGEDDSHDKVVSSVDKGRVKFMLEALSDLKNNKSSSRRQQSAQAESVQQMRRWIGRVKVAAAAGGGTAGDACLHISLLDFLQAETRGRWWRAGASWGGRTAQAKDAQRDREKQAKAASEANGRSSTNTTPDEEKQLLKVAKKLGMNTDIRKNIFLVVMSSRDVTDAFERLVRLDLKGKQDREVARVLCECCGSEKNYNEFYAELAALFCMQNRQYKITLQYAFWDLFKILNEDDAESKKKTDRRAINMARMLAHLTVQFHMSLSVLKVVDASELSSGMMLFLATFFMSVFSAKISSETFMSVLDRVATTSDCLVVREFVLIFLQHHFKKIPSGLPKAETKLMEKRRKDTIRTMEAMSVLDIAQGVAEREDNKQPQFDDF